MYARVHRPSILVPCATALFIVSGRVFKRCNVLHVAPMHRIVAESVNSGMIMACVGREKGKTVEKGRLAILHENTTKHAFSRYHDITQLWCHYTAIIHCLWIQKHITRLLQASRLYILDSSQHQQHDRFYDTLHRQSSWTSNMTEYNNRSVLVNWASCTVHLFSVSLLLHWRKDEWCKKFLKKSAKKTILLKY